MANKYLKVTRPEGEFYVRYEEARIWDSMSIFEYRPNRLFFKYKCLNTYLYCILCDLARREGRVDSNSDNYMVQVAEYAVDFYIAARKQEAAAAEKRNRQEAYFAKMSV